MPDYKNIPGEVQWFINDRCNYRCSYCFVDRAQSSDHFYVKNYRAYLERFKRVIPSGWQFTLLGGGEPSMHPQFKEIVNGLVGAGYLIGVNSNLSATHDNLREFFRITADKLVFFIASLHLEHIDPQIFIHKINALKKEFPKFLNWQAVSVALPGKLAELIDISGLFKAAGIRFYLQPYRSADHSYYIYTNEEQKNY